MSLLTNRKGDWIQLFLVAFFFLILFISLMLLFLEKDSIRIERPETPHDLQDFKQQAVLLSVLRTPVDVDIAGGPTETTLANALVVGKLTETDLKTHLLESIPKNIPFVFTVKYHDKTLEVDRAQRFGDTLIENRLPRGQALLPGTNGDITVTLAYPDRESLLYLFSYKPPDEQVADVDSILAETGDLK